MFLPVFHSFILLFFHSFINQTGLPGGVRTGKGFCPGMEKSPENSGLRFDSFKIFVFPVRGITFIDMLEETEF